MLCLEFNLHREPIQFFAFERNFELELFKYSEIYLSAHFYSKNGSFYYGLIFLSYFDTCFCLTFSSNLQGKVYFYGNLSSVSKVCMQVFYKKKYYKTQRIFK